MSVLLAVPGSLGALDHEVQEPGVILLADDEGVGVSGFSRAKRHEFIGKAVENGMVLDFDVDLHSLGPFLEVLDGIDELLHLAGRTLSDESSSNHAGYVRLAPVFDLEDQAERAGRMAGNENGSYARVAESDGHAFEGIHVTLGQRHWRGGISTRRRRARNVYEIPVGRGHVEVSAIMLLQIGGAAVMVFVAMGQDNDLDIGGIQAQSLQSGQKNGLNILGVARVDQHDSS